MKAIITEPIHEVGMKMLREHFNLVTAYGMNMDTFLPFCTKENPDAIVIRGIPYRITKALIDGCPNLKAIAANVVGVDNIDVEYCKEKGIPVYNVPGGSSDSVAELAFGHILNLARHISQADYNVRYNHIYNKQLHIGIMLQNKTLGIVALGRIGKRVAKFANAFDMNVIGFDPYVTDEQAAEHGITKASLEDIFSKSDFVLIPAPLTKDNYHMINADLISRMKPTAYLIDVGRGGVLDEDALYDALANKRIAGAALDVFEKEPPLGQRILELENIVVSPHIGGSSEEAQRFLSTTCCTKLLEYLKLI